MTNIPGFNAHLLSHNHEEADTLLILHAIDVARSDPFQKLIVQSPDTDVFLLLIYYQRRLCNHTIFKTGISFNYIHFKCSNKEPERGVKNFDTIFILTGRGKDIREIDVTAAYEAVGSEIASAILGFHAFSGCDFTSKFNNKSKKVMLESLYGERCSSKECIYWFDENSCQHWPNYDCPPNVYLRSLL